MLIGTWDTPGYASELAINGGLAFVADQAGGLQVFDVFTPESPVLIGSFSDMQFASDVSVMGAIVYLADPIADELVIVDVSEPTSPQMLSRTTTAANPAGLAVSGSVASVRCDAVPDRVEFYDVSDPAHPALLGDYRNSSTMAEVAVEGDLLFVTGGVYGVDIVDISEPQSPQRLTAFGPEYSTSALAVRNNRCYLDLSIGTTLVLDVTEPLSPAEVTFLDGSVIAMDADDNLLVTVGPGPDNAVRLFDITDPTPYPVISEFETGSAVTCSALAGSTLLVGRLENVLALFDVSDPGAVVQVGTYICPGIPRAVRVVGTKAYVAAGDGGLEILDISDPSDPRWIGGYSNGRHIWSVDVEGDVACIIDDIALETLDVSQPLFTSRYARLIIYGDAQDVRVKAGFAYVTDSPRELRVYDITDPVHPTLSLEWDDPWEFSQPLVFHDDLAVLQLMRTGSHRMLILDLSSPPEPTVVAEFSPDEPSLVYEFEGDTLLLSRSAPFGDGIEFVDFSNPAEPVSKGVWGTTYVDKGVHLAGELAYLVGSVTGFAVDLTDCPPCPADLTGDGTVNTQDFIAFLNAWAAGEPLADWNEDGSINTQDFIAYLNDWASPC